MVRGLVAAIVIWPLLLAAGLHARVHGAAPWLNAAVYLAGATVCHQKADRSFHTAGAKWPVCARCSGLYLAAPIGALAALAPVRRARRGRSDLTWLAAAAAPTALTVIVEHGGLGAVSSEARFAAALPLGAAVAWVMVRAARAGAGPGIG